MTKARRIVGIVCGLAIAGTAVTMYVAMVRSFRADDARAKLEALRVEVPGEKDVDRALAIKNAVMGATPEERAKQADEAEFKHLKYASDQALRGDAKAEFEMGLRYRDGRGVAVDVRRARELLAASARQGVEEATVELAKLPKAP